MAQTPRESKHHEAIHVKDQELEFKIAVRRNKLLGLWAADKKGLAGDAATAYAKEVIAADFEEPGDDDVVRKVMADFRANNVAITEDQLREQMRTLWNQAREQLTARG